TLGLCGRRAAYGKHRAGIQAEKLPRSFRGHPGADAVGAHVRCRLARSRGHVRLVLCGIPCRVRSHPRAAYRIRGDRLMRPARATYERLAAEGDRLLEEGGKA